MQSIYKKTDYVMACYTEIFSVANNIKKFHILYNLHYVYQKNFYHDKQKEIDKFFDEYHIPLLENIDHAALIQ